MNHQLPAQVSRFTIGNLFKHFISGIAIAVFFCILTFPSVIPVEAGLLDKVNSEGGVSGKGLEAVGREAYDQAGSPLDVRMIIIRIILVFLQLLALIFLVYIFWAGFTWMTAAGDSKKVDDAKHQIKAAIFGLFIILAAWGITKWILSNVANVTGARLY
jgi:hypothetical protein